MEQKDPPRGRKLSGRPVLESGKRSKKIDVRFTDEEHQMIADLANVIGLSKTELVRMRVLQSATAQLINGRELLSGLDKIGAELGKSGSNINQLARYANTLQKRGMLSVHVVERLNLLFSVYLKNQSSLELVLRKIMRAMSK